MALSIRCFSPRLGSTADKFGQELGRTKTRKRLENQNSKGKVFFSSFLWIPDPSKCFPQQVTRSDNVWNHIGKLENPTELLIANRYPVEDILFANEVILVKAHNGLCAVYMNWSNEFVCYLNSSNGEIVRSLFFNYTRFEVIVISTFKSDGYTGMRCYAIKTSELYKGKNQARQKLFSEHPIVYPGFIELDNTNARAAIFFGPGKSYRIFSLTDYSPLFDVSSSDVMDIKMTPNSFMAIKLLSFFRAKLVFYDVDAGNAKGDVSFHLIPSADIQFIERCGISILYKQAGNEIHCYNIATRETRIIPHTESCRTQEFLFLYNAKIFLIFVAGKFECYTFEGIHCFTISAQNPLSLSPLCVCPSQRYLVCLSKQNGAIKLHLFDLKTGREEFSSEINANLLKGFKLTSLAFENDSHCIVCGDEVGNIHFWL